MSDAEKEAFVERFYDTPSPTPDMNDEFGLIMFGTNCPASN